MQVILGGPGFFKLMVIRMRIMRKLRKDLMVMIIRVVISLAVIVMVVFLR